MLAAALVLGRCATASADDVLFDNVHIFVTRLLAEAARLSSLDRTRTIVLVLMRQTERREKCQHSQPVT